MRADEAFSDRHTAHTIATSRTDLGARIIQIHLHHGLAVFIHFLFQFVIKGFRCIIVHLSGKCRLTALHRCKIQVFHANPITSLCQFVCLFELPVLTLVTDMPPDFCQTTLELTRAMTARMKPADCTLTAFQLVFRLLTIRRIARAVSRRIHIQAVLRIIRTNRHTGAA